MGEKVFKFIVIILLGCIYISYSVVNSKVIRFNRLMMIIILSLMQRFKIQRLQSCLL